MTTLGLMLKYRIAPMRARRLKRLLDFIDAAQDRREGR